MHIETLLMIMKEAGGSDLFIKSHAIPRIRINGVVQPLKHPQITPGDIETLLEQLLNAQQLEQVRNCLDFDTAVHFPTIGRFRINLLHQQGEPGMVIRLIHVGILGFKELGLPDAIRRLAGEPRGLVLVTGAAGSGKSTTVAAMIQHINHSREGHIVTIEDPIEYVFEDECCIINQRQVGIDTHDFAAALKHVIRQSPDVIMIGEIRDLETIKTALSAAQTGHLVITTMHTSDIVQTLERIVNYYPDYLRGQVRFELSLALRGIICQRLLPRVNSPGRVPAFEILLNSPAIRKFLVEGRHYDVLEEVRKNNAAGMCSLNQSLLLLVNEGAVDEETALHYSNNPDELRLNLRGLFTGLDTFQSG
ncbi:PilT/PilU family type 4a pilus ATPase [bacterium]|nr:PilT/PilU family type 4a pilus ATPase [candidate division CSSED10-310 bacterium]